MAHSLRLIALLLLCAWSPAFAACINSGTYTYCDSEAEASSTMQARCQVQTGFHWGQITYSVPLTVTTFNGLEYKGRMYPQQARDGDNKLYNCPTGALPNTAWWRDGPAPNECDARNSDPEQAPGTRLSLAQNSGPKCVGGCTLDVVGDPLETVPGRVQGQPVVYYRWNQEYTGETCDGDPDPGDNSNDLDPTETPDGEKQCNPSLGVCVDENGNNEYCTFNPDGTPSTCVPAVDYDNDGVNDDDDTQPGDPNNGADDGEGNEGDNSASGGAKCPHDGGGPPACKGDAIQCNLLLQQYLSRCSAEKAATGKVAGGIACTSEEPLTCTNLSPAECWAKAMQKKAACAADGIAQALTGEPGEELPDADPSTAWVDEAGEGGDIELDMGGWLGARTCPVLPSFSVMGKTISFDSLRADMCAFFSVGGMLVLLFAAFSAAKILGET